MRLRIHEFAYILPVATSKEKDALKEDIARHGVKVPIVLFQGKILDGRSRYEVGKELDVEIPVTEFNGTAKNALDLVASYNLYRRHLNPSQKAVVAARIAAQLQEVDGIDEAECLKEAAEITGATERYTRAARRLEELQPRTTQEILEGKTTIGTVLGRHKTKCPSCGFEW